MQTINFPRGHGILKAYMGLRPQDPDTLAHEALLKQAYGEQRAEEYLSRSIHHVLIYPYLSVQSPLQQLRCLRPISPDKTLSEIWHFRLKGAPEAIYRRSLWYYNLVNSPATMINADDLENWTKGQWGLQSNGGDWVSFHRYFGDDREEDGVTYSNHGTSEAVMRSQFRAWSTYMAHRQEHAMSSSIQQHERGDSERRTRLRAPARAGRGDRGRDRRRAHRRAGDRARPFAARAAASAPRRRPDAAAGRPGRAGTDLQREVEQFLYLQAELLDGKHWQAWMDLFDDARRLLDAGHARADRVGGLAVDLRRGQADDGDPQGPRLAPQRMVAGADVGDQPRRRQCRDRSRWTARRSRCARAST